MKHTDLIADDLAGIDPQEMAAHLRAVASLTKDQLSGMLGWAQQEQDRDVYRLAFELLYQGRPDESVISLALDPDAPPCLDCHVRIPLDAPAYAVDGGGVCGPCGIRRYGDNASEYLIP